MFPISLVLALAAAETPDSLERVDYGRDIKPLFVEKCYSCHGAWKKKAKLRVETIALLKTGGRSGPAVVPGRPDQSLILAHLTGKDDLAFMPPHGEGEPLTPAQLATVRRWIEQGAHGLDEPPPPDPREHWAFRVPVRPVVPTVKNAGWVRNPIDAFLARGHEANGLVPEPEADSATLLRRVTLDLTGLPPTPAEIDAFLAARKHEPQAAFEAVVDRLLASPAYGERWGRHWLDVWRYSDWSGENNNQVRGSPKHIWRWRDWVVESLNVDAGYDRMVSAMLAADEIAPNDPATLRATGFLARNFYTYNRNVWLDDTVEHTAKAFLGLTIACARCHDHKFDPLSQEDYYRLRAVFEPHRVRTDRVPGQKDVKKDGLVRVMDTEPLTPTFLFRRGEETQPVTENPLSPAVPAIFGAAFDAKPVRVGPDGAGAAAVAGPLAAVLPPAESTGRRLALAQWITDPGNPLTARVAVNHVWLRHFGAPLVADVADFGLRSPAPRQADLLDWLACELRDGGWSLKKLHRLIVTSAAYRMKSDHRDARSGNRTKDPENLWYWRMNARRLEAEAVRDCVLAVGGSLDTRMGGPEIALAEGETTPRRSLYFRHAHERQVKFLEAFDAANPLECYRRAVTVVPQQALALFNSPLALDQSRLLAGKLAKDPEGAFVIAAFRHVLGREPTAAEAARCRSFLTAQAATLADPTKLSPTEGGPMSRIPPASDPKRRARENLVHALFNHTDFVTIR